LHVILFDMEQPDIIDLIKKDEWMLRVLRTVEKLQLPDWWIGAGFIRNKVWDALHGYATRTPLNDVDVIYFDPSNKEESREKELERELQKIMPGVPWSVKNQARMNTVSNAAPYTSSEDGLSRWPETATCIATKINRSGEVALIAPYGTADMINLIVRVSPRFGQDINIFRERYQKKNWKKLWPKLQIIE